MTPEERSALIAELRAAEAKMNEANDVYHEVPGRWKHYEMVYTSLLKKHAPALCSEVERLQRPVDSYSCQRCGRADGLDAVVPNDVWRTISPRGDEGGLLCLWCIDELCGEHGITCSASLHYAGKHITGGSQSDADAEHIARLADQVERLQAENERLRSAGGGVTSSPSGSDSGG